MTLDTGDTSLSAPIRMGQPGATNYGHNRFGLTGRSKSFDPRIAAIRPDLADVAVAGEYFAPHYAAPMMCSGVVPIAAIRAEPSLEATQVNELLFGEAFALLDVTGGWAWGYSHKDHYVGYLAIEALGNPIAPTHRVIAQDAPIYSSPDVASGSSAILPRGALLMGDVDDRGEWLSVANGYVALSALVEVDVVAPDAADIAEALIGAPYLWGGRTHKGVDCSGLVQMAWGAAGVSLPRDSDLQLAALGDDKNVAPADLARGDLVFFPGHVGIMADGDTIIHASRHWQAVRREKLCDVIARSAEKQQDQPVSAYKRLR